MITMTLLLIEGNGLRWIPASWIEVLPADLNCLLVW